MLGLQCPPLQLSCKCPLLHFMRIKLFSLHMYVGQLLSVYSTCGSFPTSNVQITKELMCKFGCIKLLMCLFFKSLSILRLQLRETNFTRLCTTKSMFTVNGQWPGPTIHVRKGDKAFVNVHNNGDYGVTIHW